MVAAQKHGWIFLPEVEQIIDHPNTIWATVDIVAKKDKLVPFPRLDDIDQTLQVVKTTVDIADSQ